MPRSALLILAAALAALAFVFTMQYALNYDPCIMCLYQRGPYAAAILLAIFALIGRRLAWLWLGLCAVAFAIGAALAVFHTGIERHWWLGTSGCAITPLKDVSDEDALTRLLHTATAHCDQISWTFLGLTMANYNIACSLVLLVFSFIAARKAWR